MKAALDRRRFLGAALVAPVCGPAVAAIGIDLASAADVTAVTVLGRGPYYAKLIETRVFTRDEILRLESLPRVV